MSAAGVAAAVTRAARTVCRRAGLSRRGRSSRRGSGSDRRSGRAVRVVRLGAFVRLLALTAAGATATACFAPALATTAIRLLLGFALRLGRRRSSCHCSSRCRRRRRRGQKRASIRHSLVSFIILLIALCLLVSLSVAFVSRLACDARQLGVFARPLPLQRALGARKLEVAAEQTTRECSVNRRKRPSGIKSNRSRA